MGEALITRRGGGGVGGKSEILIQTYYTSGTVEKNHQISPGISITVPTGYSVSGIAEIRLTGSDGFYFSYASEDHLYLVLNNDNNENWRLGGKLVPRGFTASTITVSIEVDIIFTKVRDQARSRYPYNRSLIYYYMPYSNTSTNFPANTPITIA